GQLPWVSLILAFAFALYGVVRKHCVIDGISGMTVETMWLLPLALLWISWQYLSPSVSLNFGTDNTLTLLLIGVGFVSALPLVLFAMATRRIDLSVVGFIMYINPTMQFLIGVFILKEPYPPERLITFALIWLALLLFTIGLISLRKTNASLQAST
ncbi:MAG: EamA family transporter RarD, partial [Methylophaga sp.]|nr:EamA family transporter RarD [Methylophaga sp.]